MALIFPLPVLLTLFPTPLSAHPWFTPSMFPPLPLYINKLTFIFHSQHFFLAPCHNYPCLSLPPSLPSFMHSPRSLHPLTPTLTLRCLTRCFPSIINIYSTQKSQTHFPPASFTWRKQFALPLHPFPVYIYVATSHVFTDIRLIWFDFLVKKRDRSSSRHTPQPCKQNT